MEQRILNHEDGASPLEYSEQHSEEDGAPPWSSQESDPNTSCSINQPVVLENSNVVAALRQTQQRIDKLWNDFEASTLVEDSGISNFDASLSIDAETQRLQRIEQSIHLALDQIQFQPPRVVSPEDTRDTSRSELKHAETSNMSPSAMVLESPCGVITENHDHDDAPSEANAHYCSAPKSIERKAIISRKEQPNVTAFAHVRDLYKEWISGGHEASSIDNVHAHDEGLSLMTAFSVSSQISSLSKDQTMILSPDRYPGLYARTLIETVFETIWCDVGIIAGHLFGNDTYEVFPLLCFLGKTRRPQERTYQGSFCFGLAVLLLLVDYEMPCVAEQEESPLRWYAMSILAVAATVLQTHLPHHFDEPILAAALLFLRSAYVVSCRLY